MTDTMLFRKCCVSVYGKRWQKDFASSIGLSPVTVNRHLKAQDIPPSWFSHVMIDAMKNIKTLIIAAEKQGIEFPLPQKKGD